MARPLADVGVGGHEENRQDCMLLAGEAHRLEAREAGMRTSEIIMLKLPARRVSRASSPDATGRYRSLGCAGKNPASCAAGSSSTIRMRALLRRSCEFGRH